MRAAMIAAQGDLTRAAAYGGGGWETLVKGDVAAALQSARKAVGAPGMAFLEAEALFSAGAVVAGLERLEALHARGDPAGTLALVRRRHQLGDHVGAVRVAQALPWHAQAALTGARSALIANRSDVAFRFVDPFLQGIASLPEPAVAGAAAVLVASILAKSGESARLRTFVDRLVNVGDLPEDMMPAVARAAWIGGRGREAWQRFAILEGPWTVVARLELALLAGNPDSALRLLERAGPLGSPSAPAVRLLKGDPLVKRDVETMDGPYLTDKARQMFGEGRTVHVWRTHPHRWQSWIEAAMRTPANVVVCDLAAGQLPDPEELPWAVVDDGALIDALVPVPIPPASPSGTGVRIGSKLCQGVGIGHDWPEKETKVVRRALPSPRRKKAAVQILGADEALACISRGRPLVVIAPPGDPFWAGPLPERVWPSVRIVRADPQTGWEGTGGRVVEAAEALLAPGSG